MNVFKIVPQVNAVDTPTLASTLILTLLMAIGLLFFIRASTKDRIEQVRLVSEQPDLPAQLQQYFTQRAFRIAGVDAAKNQVIYEGLVRPSLFLAIFLTTLAGVGMLCLALVLSFALPNWSGLLPGLALLSPLAGIFYWKKSERQEQVALSIEQQAPTQSILTVTAHRDELAELQQNLSLKPLE